MVAGDGGGVKAAGQIPRQAHRRLADERAAVRARRRACRPARAAGRGPTPRHLLSTRRYPLLGSADAPIQRPPQHSLDRLGHIQPRAAQGCVEQHNLAFGGRLVNLRLNLLCFFKV